MIPIATPPLKCMHFSIPSVNLVGVVVYINRLDIRINSNIRQNTNPALISPSFVIVSTPSFTNVVPCTVNALSTLQIRMKMNTPFVPRIILRIGTRLHAHTPANTAVRNKNNGRFRSSNNRIIYIIVNRILTRGSIRWIIESTLWYCPHVISFIMFLPLLDILILQYLYTKSSSNRIHDRLHRLRRLCMLTRYWKSKNPQADQQLHADRKLADRFCQCIFG